MPVQRKARRLPKTSAALLIGLVVVIIAGGILGSLSLLAHFGVLVQDVVIAGPDREFPTALFFPALEMCRKLCAGLLPNAPAAEVLAQPEVRVVFQEQLDSFASAGTGSSTRIERAILLDTPPSIEVQEITDKGSINQKAVLGNRAALVEEREGIPRRASVPTVPRSSRWKG